MGDVVDFATRADGAARVVPASAEPATVVILPVIRIERCIPDPWDGLPSDSAPHHAALYPDDGA
ncbi:hypothetical protein [Bradyrhizobium cenepequi]